jgi:hypothetical protein
MPIIQPGRADVHINRPLTNVANAFWADQNDFAFDKVFPVVPVEKQSDLYWNLDPNRDLLRDEMAERAPLTESDGNTFNFSTTPYFVQEFSLHYDIPDNIRANADGPIDMDMIATRALMQKYLIKAETLWSSRFFTQTNPGDVWAFDVDGVASAPTASAAFDPTNAGNNDVLQWNDASSNPIEDIRRGKRAIKARTGLNANKLTLQEVVYDTLLDHPDIVGRIDRGQTSGAAKVNRVTLADLFELDEVVVMGSARNSAQKGATAIIDYIGGKHALLTHTPANAGQWVGSAGYVFDWTSAPNRGIKKMRLETKNGDRIEMNRQLCFQKVSAELGYFFNGIVA